MMKILSSWCISMISAINDHEIVRIVSNQLVERNERRKREYMFVRVHDSSISMVSLGLIRKLLFFWI